MSTDLRLPDKTEAAILTRIVRPDQDDLPVALAKAVLRLDLHRSDLDRLHELVVRNQDDRLTADERAELQSYLRVSSFFDLMHAKARRSLKKHG